MQCSERQLHRNISKGFISSCSRHMSGVFGQSFYLQTVSVSVSRRMVVVGKQNICLSKTEHCQPNYTRKKYCIQFCDMRGKPSEMNHICRASACSFLLQWELHSIEQTLLHLNHKSIIHLAFHSDSFDL